MIARAATAWRARGGAARGALVLFVMSSVANVLAYAYQVVMARLLPPEQYAILTVLFGVLLLETISMQVIQSATAKLTAQYFARGGRPALDAFAKRWLRRLAVGAAPIAVAIVILAGPISEALDVTATSVVLLGGTLFVAVVLTFALGLLQGLARFVELGANLITQAATRLAIGVALVAFGLGVDGAFVGASAALVVAFAIGVVMLRDVLFGPADVRADTRPENEVRFFALAAVVLLAYAGLTNADAVLARALLSDADAGAYAGAITMGKVVLFAPIAVGFVLLERTARAHELGEPTERLLALAVGFVLLTSGAVAIAYVVAPAPLTRLVVGEHYGSTAELVPWYALASLSNAVLTLWNAYFVGLGRLRVGILLAIALAVEVALLAGVARDPLTMVRIVALTSLAVQVAMIALFVARRGRA